MTIKATATRGFVDGANRVRRNATVNLTEKDFERLSAIGLVKKATAADQKQPPADDLETRSVADLVDLAKAGDIELGEAKKKAEIIAAIRAARAKA